MRVLLQMLQEIAAEANPEKKDVYQEAYPALDASLSAVRRGSASPIVLREVMTTSDFPFALGEYVNRALWPSYQRAAFGFEPLVFNDTLPNFQEVTRYQRQSGLQDLEMVKPKQQAGQGGVPDAYKRQYRVYRWAKDYDFEAEAIFNDDLGYFADQARLMGESARRTLEKFVSRMYFNTTTLAALVALGALYSGTAKLSTSALMTAWAAFNQRTDAVGEPITTNPVYLVIHRGLRPLAEQILRSPQVAENANNNVNVLPPLTIIEDPYISGTAPDLPWFLFSPSNQGGIRPLTLARLQGVPGPLVIQKTPDMSTFAGFGQVGAVIPAFGDFETGNIRLKVMDVWGGWADSTYAGLTDYRGVYYSSATA